MGGYKANWPLKKKARYWNITLHRDLGYFFSSLLIAYCLSGLALNHIDDWNPDFIITKENIRVQKNYTVSQLTPAIINEIGAQVGESSYKVYDSPTPNQVKIYYDNASLHLNLEDKTGIYEKVTRRPLFYQTNVLHRNSIKGWKWAADVFAFFLIVITITGMFVVKGKYGLAKRGVWFILAGMLPFIIAFIINEIV